MDKLKEVSTPLCDSQSDQPVSWVKTLDNLPRVLTKTKSLPPVAQINAGTPAPDDTSSGKSVEPMVSQQSRLETQGPTQHSRSETHGTASSLPNNKVNPSNESDLQIVTRSGRAVGLNNIRSKGFGDNVGHMVPALSDLHTEHRSESLSTAAPTVPSETLTLEQAIP
ncbi:hypothetical protein K3495_g14257 [Podosphaera aphanis]|nr:hypothetical protein K3495_g14257 [Podosphaera aphanis]